MLATVPSLVHHKETSGRFDSIDTYGDILRRSCRPDYLAADAVYSFLDGDAHFGNASTLSQCRDKAWFTRNDDSGDVRIASKTCHLRWCPLCAAARRNYISFEVNKWVESLKHPKFLTLTMKHTDAPLSHQVMYLYKYFRSLRKMKYFNELVTGGIWFFQIKKSKSDSRWHPHIHCLIGGKYIPHGWLSKAWCKVTYGSSIVDIRPIKDSRKASNDAARYAACPGSLHGLSLEDGVDLVTTMHGKRIVGTWGSARCVSLRAPKISESGKWSNIGSWYHVMSSRDEDQNARAIAYAFYNNQPLAQGIDMAHVDPELHRLDEIDVLDYDLDEMYPQCRGSPW